MLYDAREAELRDQLTRMKSEKNKGRAEGRAEGEVIGETRGKGIMAQDAIRQYLEARLGVESQALQETVRAITDLDTLSRIMNRIFIGTPLEEVTALIQGNCEATRC